MMTVTRITTPTPTIPVTVVSLQTPTRSEGPTTVTGITCVDSRLADRTCFVLVSVLFSNASKHLEISLSSSPLFFLFIAQHGLLQAVITFHNSVPTLSLRRQHCLFIPGFLLTNTYMKEIAAMNRSTGLF